MELPYIFFYIKWQEKCTQAVPALPTTHDNHKSLLFLEHFSKNGVQRFIFVNATLCKVASILFACYWISIDWFWLIDLIANTKCVIVKEQ